jgi:hypothetical protein
MNEGDPPADDLTPAERGLTVHLELLRAGPPIAATQLIPRLVRKLRWQRAVREPLLLVGAVAAAITEGLRLLMKPPADRS